MQRNFMSYKSITRFASLLLAVGFFYGCSSSAPTVDTYLDQGLYEEALAEIDQQLERNPDQPDLYIQKGEILLEIALNESVENRDMYYVEAVETFNEAEFQGITDEQSNDIEKSLNDAWVNELNAGTDIYADDTIVDRTEIAIAHFDNAIILNESEPTAYLSKSVALYNSNELNDAIETLNEARGTISDVPEKLYEYLGFLHLQNSNAEQAKFYYELANTDIASNKNIAFGLVNIYILNRERERAIDLLQDLNNGIPNDARIKNVLGTQLFFIAEGVLNDLSDAYITNDLTMVDQLKFEAEGVGEQAEEELINAYQLESTNPEYIQSLAVFYNNLTGMYLSLAEIAPEEDVSLFNNKAETLIGFAIQYYELLASINPGDAEITSSIEMLKQLQTNRFSD
jgi:tetratricopeptide (TPR) repeat protein